MDCCWVCSWPSWSAWSAVLACFVQEWRPVRRAVESPPTGLPTSDLPAPDRPFRTSDSRTMRPGNLVVAPDRTRSAVWTASLARDNAVVHEGSDGTGRRLFTTTLVVAESPAHAARLAARLGGTADRLSLGEQGSTGPLANRLYYCELSAMADEAVVGVSDSDRPAAMAP
jgi:hypothetical protein